MEKSKIDAIINNAKKHNDHLSFNLVLFEIMEGDVMKYLAAELIEELSERSAQNALKRSCPINVARKLVSKLSPLYTERVIRTTELPSDQELIDFYVTERALDSHMTDVNVSFNAYKQGMLELYEYNGELKYRSVPAHVYVPYSDDPINPLTMTALVKIIGSGDELKYWIYTDDEFISVTKDGDLILSDMEESGGINPFGLIPHTYVQASRYMLIPLKNTGLRRFATLFGKLLTEVNFGAMYAVHPTVYGINVDIENLSKSPDVFWGFTQGDGDQKPEIGVIKPDPQLKEQIESALSQLAAWFQTEDVKPGTAVGQLNGDNLASGINLIIQNMDTYENVRKQMRYFEAAEQDLWYRTAVMHNTLVKAGRLDNRKLFSDPEKLKVNVVFSEPSILESPMEKVQRLKAEMDASLITREMAIKEYRGSNISEEEINEILNDESFIVQPQVDNEIPTTESND